MAELNISPHQRQVRRLALWVALGLSLAVILPCKSQASDQLAAGFTTPPDSARPHTFWHWMNGHVTREGITSDLEEMKRVGLGGFLLWNTWEGVPPGPVEYMSENWWELIAHTFAEAGRLGLKMGFFNCAGWSSTGGPWVTPDYAMQELVWTERRITGPARFDRVLETPEPAIGIHRDMARDPEINKRYYVDPKQVEGYFREIAVLAFPTPKSDGSEKPFRLENWRLKAAFGRSTKGYDLDARTPAAGDMIAAEQIVDLTGLLDSDGRLVWNAPPGDWTIVRFGYQPTGRQNHPAPEAGRGLEIDKHSAAAADLHWRNFIAKLIHAAGDRAGRTFQTVTIDSFEVGHQNWSAKFEKEFRRRRGYDLLRFLPALTGRVVGSVDSTERFLWDFRKTVSDVIAENYYGRFAELSKNSGLTFGVEPYGTYGNTDDFVVAGAGDIPMTEWWAFDDRPYHAATAKLASSAAHTYGRRIADSEAFTGQPGRIFEEYPYSMKAQGDYFFCQGVNRFNFHTFVHNPYEIAPGFGLGSYGSRIDSKNTWWRFARPWMVYIARSQYLLQQGRFVADLLYYAGEDAPQANKPREELEPAPPAGYDYDLCNREILEQLKVRRGRLVLPSGMAYRVLVLPPDTHMRPGALQVIEKLTMAGAAVVGPKPFRVPGLEGGEAAAGRVEQITERLWGDCDGRTVTMNRYGRGRVYWGRPLGEILDELEILPDFAFENPGGETYGPTLYAGNGVEYIHRRAGETDLYFVSNQHHRSKTIEATFRAGGRLPELWYPDSGNIEMAARFVKVSDSRTRVTLDLDPAGSVFVVFRRPMNGRTTGEAARATAEVAGEISGPWQVSFPPNWDAPERIDFPELISWNEHSDDGIKYFSGTASYRTEFEAPPITGGQRLKLDLGDVQVIAEVHVNGQNLGVVWKAPYAVDVTDVVRPGKNSLVVRVANLWVNRLIGDERFPEDCEWTDQTGSRSPGKGLAEVPGWVIEGTPRPVKERKTFTGWRWPHLNAKKELLPSGLIGPVRLLSETIVK